MIFVEVKMLKILEDYLYSRKLRNWNSTNSSKFYNFSSQECVSSYRMSVEYNNSISIILITNIATDE